MAKDGMKRSAYCQGDPVFNEVWGKWRKEERRAREEARAMIVSGFADNVSKELPLEYAMEMNNLIRLEMKGSIG